MVNACSMIIEELNNLSHNKIDTTTTRSSLTEKLLQLQPPLIDNALDETYLSFARMLEATEVLAPQIKRLDYIDFN